MLGSGDVTSADTINGYKVLALPALFKTKLLAYKSRGNEKDYKDLVWMYESKPEAIQGSIGDMKKRLRREFLDAYADEVQNEDQAKALAAFLQLEYVD